MDIKELLFRKKIKFKKTIDYYLPDRIFIKKQFKQKMNKELNLNNPVSFNEKEQWLKLYDRKPEYINMVDKFAVREYAKSKVHKSGRTCSELGLNFVPLIGVWDKVEEINFDSLPNQFVLKCNHDNGVIICKEKNQLDIEKTKNELRSNLKRNFYKKGREWPYKNVKRKIICEKYMENTNGEKLVDYKVFCFNGIPKLIMVNSCRFEDCGLMTDMYSVDWKHLEMKISHYPNAGDIFDKPSFLLKMIEISRIMSNEIPFLRVDFNVWNQKLFLGELTFFDGAGYESYSPPEYSIMMGEWLQLPNRK